MPNRGTLTAFNWDMSVSIVTKVRYGRPAQGYQQRQMFLAFIQSSEE